MSEKTRESDERLMREAIAAAREGVERGQTPFGACIARGGEVIAAAHNCVWDATDPTAHAEVVAIRRAARSLGEIDLSGCSIYSTCEPCPMCFAAIHWAKIGRIVYAAGIADAHAAGFDELTISNEQMRRLGGARLVVDGHVLRREATAMMRDWAARPQARRY